MARYQHPINRKQLLFLGQSIPELYFIGLLRVTCLSLSLSRGCWIWNSLIGRVWGTGLGSRVNLLE